MSKTSLIAEASAAGLFFPLAIVAGYLLGKAVAGAFGWGRSAAFVGAALGVVAAFLNLARFLRRMEDRGRAENRR